MSEVDGRLKSEVSGVLSLATIRYSQVWEDHRLLEGALPLGPQDEVLCVTSGGCNVLNLLLAGPKRVVALDMNPMQSALLELKLAAARSLGHEDFLVLLGVMEAERGFRLTLYEHVRPGLSEEAASLLDRHAVDIARGLHHAGRLERYFADFRDNTLPGLWSADLWDRLIGAFSLPEQAELARTEALTPAFQAAFREHFGRERMAAQGRDPAQFKHVQDGDVGGYFLGRVTWALTETRLSDNPYLQSFFAGRYASIEEAPPYLRADRFDELAAKSDRVEIVTAELEEYLARVPPGRFAGAGLSDAFEYMSPMLAEAVLAGLARALRRGGRLAYWNLLVPRSRPKSLEALLEPKPELGRRLWQQDRSWFYRAFVVEERR